MRVLKLAAAAAVLHASVAGAALAEAPDPGAPVLRASVLETGTVDWELNTIAHYGLDAKHGFTLAVTHVAGQQASQVAFLGGEADMIVVDWLWVARQRAAGRDIVFLPYSKAVGGLMVPANSPAKTLRDLAGGRIGVAGGPVDKSWIILRAYARKVYGMDLATETAQVFAAPPLVFQAATSGQLDGAVNFWQFMAKMQAAGMRTLVSVDEAAKELGLDAETPLLGFVLHGEMVRERPELVAGLAAASRDAKALLATDDAAWERLRPMMHAASEAEFEALKAGYRAGIPGDAPVDEAAADRMLKLMAELGGEEIVGGATSLPEGVFLRVDR
jgi:NitT/TauT family transport system substrate-binding protein